MLPGGLQRCASSSPSAAQACRALCAHPRHPPTLRSSRSRYYPREPRQVQLQLELSMTAPKRCSAVRWEGRGAHPVAIALQRALATAVGGPIRQALAPVRLAMTLRLACTDPPRGQTERRLRATLTIAAAHPRWQLPSGAAATLGQACWPLCVSQTSGAPGRLPTPTRCPRSTAALACCTSLPTATRATRRSACVAWRRPARPAARPTTRAGTRPRRPPTL